jgi:hypothetical protein
MPGTSSVARDDPIVPGNSNLEPSGSEAKYAMGKAQCHISSCDSVTGNGRRDAELSEHAWHMLCLIPLALLLARTELT